MSRKSESQLQPKLQVARVEGPSRLPKAAAVDPIVFNSASRKLEVGEFFRAAIRRANETSGLPVTDIKEREILNRGVAELGLPLEQIQGRMFGPRGERMRNSRPWQAGS